MVHKAIVERYARTFLLAGKQAGSLDVIESDLNLVLEVLNKNQEFQAFIVNPVISLSNKESVINKSFGSKISELSVHFLRLLIKKNRLELLGSVIQEFQKVLDTHNNVVKGTIFSVTPLNDDQMSQITKLYEKRENITHVFDNQIDESLIGGFVVRVGDLIEDHSLQNKLEHLKNKLLA
jgi:F-type H+-transporting ATPase subunit delta